MNDPTPAANNPAPASEPRIAAEDVVEKAMEEAEAWISNQHTIEDELISELERIGLGTLPIMTNSLHNEEIMVGLMFGMNKGKK